MTEIIRAFLRIFLLCLAINSMRMLGLCLLHADGLVNISAITALVVYSETHSFILTILVATVITLLVNTFFVYLTKRRGVSDIVYGIAMNLILRGLSGLILYLYAGDLAMSTSVNVNFDLKIFGIDIFIVLGLVLSLIYYIYLYKTRAGLELRAVGLDEEKASFRKLNIARARRDAILFASVFAALVGSFLSLSYFSYFTENISQNVGYICLALEGFSVIHPALTPIASLVYAVFTYLAGSFQSVAAINYKLLDLIPYLVILLFLYCTKYSQKKGSMSNIGETY
ncbi:ABC transporter permease subunit [Fenollaria timonensis]|uniref:ABC transporter permease subunit n=1 Tax=Fenollaria timonensis TaxID=1723384 RepID=UPI00071DE03F|nr:ABC transporter permease [Fenollaria timonensis]